MLVLSRKSGEKVQIGHEIILTIEKVRGNRVLISIEAPTQVSIRRMELARFAANESIPVIRHSLNGLEASSTRIVESVTKFAERDTRHESKVS